MEKIEQFAKIGKASSTCLQHNDRDIKARDVLLVGQFLVDREEDIELRFA